jgi:DNA-binding transcriptional ArsR family regulator
MGMARAPTTLDPFNAVAEPKRRLVLEKLANRELPVNDLVELLGWNQPAVSKHLGVLKQVGLVSVRQEGRKRLYSLHGAQLKPIHDWVTNFEQFWGERLDVMNEYLRETKNKEEKNDRRKNES